MGILMTKSKYRSETEAIENDPIYDAVLSAYIWILENRKGTAPELKQFSREQWIQAVQIAEIHRIIKPRYTIDMITVYDTV